MLDEIPLFAALCPEERELIASKAVIRRYPKNTLVINEGDSTDSMYVILEGRVKVYLSDENGKEIIINTQGPGEYFGELALLDRAPRSASVITVEAAKLAMIAKSDFDACLTAHPEIALKLIETLTQRIRHLTESVKNLALLDVYGRVARTLLDLAEDDDGKQVIHQKLTQQDIGNMVGASREMVSRILKDLSTGGYIKNEGGYITIYQKLPAAW